MESEYSSWWADLLQLWIFKLPYRTSNNYPKDETEIHLLSLHQYASASIWLIKVEVVNFSDQEWHVNNFGFCPEEGCGCIQLQTMLPTWVWTERMAAHLAQLETRRHALCESGYRIATVNWVLAFYCEKGTSYPSSIIKVIVETPAQKFLQIIPKRRKGEWKEATPVIRK